MRASSSATTIRSAPDRSGDGDSGGAGVGIVMARSYRACATPIDPVQDPADDLAASSSRVCAGNPGPDEWAGSRASRPPRPPRSQLPKLNDTSQEHNGAGRGIRTPTPLRAEHFECPVSAIPPPRLGAREAYPQPPPHQQTAQVCRVAGPRGIPESSCATGPNEPARRRGASGRRGCRGRCRRRPAARASCSSSRGFRAGNRPP